MHFECEGHAKKTTKKLCVVFIVLRLVKNSEFVRVYVFVFEIETSSRWVDSISRHYHRKPHSKLFLLTT